MRGASALAERLAAAPRTEAFVVWEPILHSDVGPPTNDVALTTDARVHRYWDPGHALSARLLTDATARPDCLRSADHPGDHVWDAVFVFPAGARWDDKIPAPSFCGRPVDRMTDGLAAALR